MQPHRPDTILVVEDDEGVAVLERRALERRGFNVRSVTTVKDAMAIISEHKVDLIIADFCLPDDATGLDLCSEIRTAGLEIPVILVTGYSDEATIIDAMRQGVRDFVPKSTDYLHYLPTAVERVLEAARAKRQLAWAEARIQAFLDMNPSPAFIKDKAGRMLYANASLQAVLGRDDWHGKTDHELWPTAVADALRQNDLAVFAGKDGSQLIESVNLPDGSYRYFACTKLAIQDVDGTPLIAGMAVDITEQRIAEEELRQRNEQLRQAQKMEAVGQLAGGIAHDFNNLLMVITGYTDMLLRERERSGSSDEEFLLEIGKAADRAAMLTKQLLAFSRKQVLAPRTIDLNLVVAGVETMLRRLIGEDIIFQTRLAGDVAKVWLDPGQVEQVIVNLVLNARDAMPLGGEISIRTENIEVDEKSSPLLGGLKPGSYVLLSVSDNGCGIAPADKLRIFEPFYTTKGPGKGTGLGLATVYGIVNQSEGYISVDSELGLGTTFKVYVPAHVSSALSPVAANAKGLDLRGSETVLLVEDEPSVRALTRIALQSYGYKVLEAYDPVDAIHICDQHHGEIDLLVTDVVMPQLGGRQLAEILQGERPHLKVLYVSGYTDDAIVRQGIEHSEVNFLQKPFAPRALAEKIRSIFGECNVGTASLLWSECRPATALAPNQ